MATDLTTRSVLRSSRRLYRRRLAALKETHKGKVISELSKAKPIIILGVQKSGTTVIAALLAETTQVSATLDFIRAIQNPGIRLFHRFGAERYEDYVYRYRREFSKHIVKEPGLTFDYDQLRRVFPRATFVMIIREPKDTIRSTLSRLQIPGDLSELNANEYPELAHSTAWRMNLDSSWLGHRPASYIDSLAYRWRLAAQTYLDHPEEFILVRYEDFLADKKAIVENLAQSLNLSIVQDIASSLDFQYQPKGKKVTDYRRFYGKNYRYIEGQCGELARRLGYQ